MLQLRLIVNNSPKTNIKYMRVRGSSANGE
jgi:hypothetical protein